MSTSHSIQYRSYIQSIYDSSYSIIFMTKTNDFEIHSSPSHDAYDQFFFLEISILKPFNTLFLDRVLLNILIYTLRSNDQVSNITSPMSIIVKQIPSFCTLQIRENVSYKHYCHQHAISGRK